MWTTSIHLAWQKEFNSHVCWSSSMSVVGISPEKGKVCGAKWKYPGHHVLWCLLWRTLATSWLPNQSASCMERELPCPCHNKWLPWLQQQWNVKLPAAHNRPYLTKTLSADEGMELNEEDVLKANNFSLFFHSAD